MAIKLNTKNFNLMRQIMKSGLFTLAEMRNDTLVISYLATIRETELAKWIEENRIDYLRGLLIGFEIDNSQEAQLKDIHTTNPLKRTELENNIELGKLRSKTD